MKIECPVCFYQAECHLCVTDKKSNGPLPGDATLCLNCGSVLLYDDKGVTEAGEEERNEILAQPGIAILQKLIKAGRQMPGRGGPR